jgi:uncharacterized membrane protein
MKRLTRLLKHRLWDGSDARRVLPAAVLRKFEHQVSASETLHSGEIRVCVEASLPLSYLWRNAPARERAIAMFGKLRVWDTEHNNGVLIYLLLAERRIELVADRALNRCVSAEEWQKLVDSMSTDFREQRFEQGLVNAIEGVSTLLIKHFPITTYSRGINELPNAPDLC